MKNQITPCLRFDGNAGEAANFYCSIFRNSKIIASNPMVISFELNGNKFLALNGGPMFQFSEAVSFVVHCETQNEIDFFWDRLTEGGEESRCGWLKDKYGVSWQIVPSVLEKQMGDPDKAPHVVEAFLKMKKFDIEVLLQA